MPYYEQMKRRELFEDIRNLKKMLEDVPELTNRWIQIKESIELKEKAIEELTPAHSRLEMSGISE